MMMSIRRLIAVLLFCSTGSVVMAQVANFDLTVGDNRFTVYTNEVFKVDNYASSSRDLYTYNLGPTGMRGWIYSATPDIVGHNNLSFWDNYTTVPPYQIMVTTVGTNTPALGKMLKDDVILGVKAGAAPVPLFTSDTRIALGNAITDAEAGDGRLCFRVDRYGISTNIYVTLQLGLSNIAYSATAPYNCPKSALLLNNALNVINARGAVRSRSEVLALMASTNTAYNSKVQTYVRGLAPSTLALSVTGPGSESPWYMGLTAVVLSEYYMKTGDIFVTNAVTQYGTIIARGDSMWGSYGHGRSLVLPYHAAAGVHGYVSAYGAMVPPTLICKLGLVLAKKTGLPGVVSHPEVQPSINRSVNFFNYYVNKGGLNYGDMDPTEGHMWNGGRAGLASLFYGTSGNYPTQTQYYVQANIADYHSREFAHNGAGLGQTWVPLGVNMGGTNAAAVYAANTRWYFELSRRSDGSFTYDCPGDSPVTAVDYWFYTSYHDYLDPTAWNALFLSVPLRQLHITGKSANTTNYISAAAATNAIWAGQYDLNKAGYTEAQLASHFSEFDPIIRGVAAVELGTRCKNNTTLRNTWRPQLITMTTNANPSIRESACNALGTIADTNTGACDALLARMTDPDVWVRYKANEALNKLSRDTLLLKLAEIATVFKTYSAPDPLVSINWEDPMCWGNGELAKILFNKMPADTIALGTNLLYQAVTAGLLGQPDGMYESGTMDDFVKNRLTWTHVQALAPVLIEAASKVSQGNHMWAGAEESVLVCLGKYGVADGLAALSVLTDSGFTHDWSRLNVAYQTYGTAATQLIPTINNMKTTIRSQAANNFYNIVTNSTTSPSVTNSFTRFTNVSASPSTVPLEASSVALSVSATNLTGGALRYAWSKASGPGVVTFIDSTSANCTASFSKAGTYVLRAGAVNSSIMNRSLFFDTTIPGGDYLDDTPMWTFNTWTNNYGITYTNVTVTVIPDTTAPTSSSFSPADNATGVALGSNLVATFNENIELGTGNITIKNLTDGTQTNIAVTDVTQVWVSGAVLTVSPMAILAGGKNYAIQIAATAVKDLSDNAFAGIVNDTAWNFATAAPVTDLTPPTPNPMTFASPPALAGTTLITMTATTASDPGGVLYRFNNVTLGTSSPWQNSPVYYAAGLSPGISYTFTVQARDKSPSENTTVASASASATTQTPDIMSLNFYSYGSLAASDYHTATLEAEESAGVGAFNVSGWRNYQVPWGLDSPANPFMLTSTLGATASFTLNDVRNGWTYDDSPNPDFGGSGDLMDSHANGTEDPGDESQKFDMTVSSIPYPVYDFIVYLGANQGQIGDGTGKLILNGGAVQNFKVSGPFSGFVGITNATTAGNYIVFRGLTNPSVNLKVWGNGFNHMGPCGFQIMDAGDTISQVTTNHDVPYAWLAAMNTSWTNNYEAAALADQDGDGYTTWQEYWSGTDPQDSSSFLKLESIAFNGANVELTWEHAQVGAGTPPVVIQSRTNLVAGAWTNSALKNPVNGTNSWSGASVAQLFFRLAVTNTP